MANMKIESIQPDQWERVEGIVLQSISKINENLTKLKNWCGKTDQEINNINQRLKVDVGNRLANLDKNSQANTLRSKCLLFYVDALDNRNSGRMQTLEQFAKQSFDHLAAITKGLNGHFPGHEQELFAYGDVKQDAYDDAYGPTNVAAVEALFATWRSQQLALEQKLDAQDCTLEELRVLAQRTRERLLSWRDTLAANQHLVEAMAQSLTAMQRDFAHLKGTQLTMPPIVEYVDQCSAQLGQQLDQAVQELQRAEQLAAGERQQQEVRVQQMVQDSQQLVGQTRDELLQTVRSAVNPVAAHVNTMHVKQDAQQARLRDVEQQGAKVPKLEDLHQQLRSDLSSAEQIAKGDADQLQREVQRLQQALEAQEQEARATQRRLEAQVQAAEHSLRDELEALEERVQDQRLGLEESQQQRTVLQSQCTELEGKLQKWVESKGLPMKISEARLFALETRLEETLRQSASGPPPPRETPSPRRKQPPLTVKLH